MKDRYDYIIVGAGSAGCALAERLSADRGNSVLLVESGPADKNPFIHMPRGIGVIANPGSKVIWEYDVQTGGNGPSERWFRGKTLGGSSSVNGMVYMRGAPMDYDGWAAAGCEGWDWKSVEQKFVELENHDLGAGESRGGHGPLRLTTHPKGDALFDDIIAAGEEMGIARVADVNNPKTTREGGLGYQPTTRHRGRRESAAKAFLTDAKTRSNFEIATETDALRIEFEGKRAVAIRLRSKDGAIQSVRADKEIIVSGGAFQTPKLLQLSGIGDAALLRSLGIDVVVDAPNVGKNLREHRHTDLRLRVKGNSQNASLSGKRAIVTALRYFLFKSGPMSHAAHEVGGFAKSSDDLDHADLQFGLMSLSSSVDKAGKIGLDPFPGITFVTYFTRPESQGEVRIQSSDPDAPLYVNVNFLSAEIDRKKFVAATRWNRRLAAQPALTKWVEEELLPGPAIQTDEDILANAMSFGGTCFHSAGTARMGTDDKAVVDCRLRVRGVEGLRVCDTSFFPTLVSGNTNGPAMMAGLMAADFILSDHAHSA
ncbi:GMC family oxidoreductase N-terminal domain-containing protein [Sphingomonas sp. BIUV-7]|uniref:GMC family oxidoreductase N-terminal domain-containing protein n=1 Tax=Sphingomonas natans TaxID=3063330 RepID=A0ABT8Y9B5_9SPHN|nr:GMC family oxidoreductase N-terminal domain-containing protein [Sphingomonas sp. BIUV-7]MDO6414567.1 GMC family oxidoreductase N-terminal domain-containing protein [Sphingomonas sp. BIUV-7]